MKYDCTKTLDYAHEVMRMCKQISCEDCLMKFGDCISIFHAKNITQNHIDIVQKWSDEHPEKTRVEVFREIFPHIGIFDPQRICFKNLVGFNVSRMECAEIGCGECWNEPYAGEFEKAREEE